MEKLNQRKIVLISLLKSKGINNPALISKVHKSTKSGLNLIYARHIKNARIDAKAYFKHIIKDRYFKKTKLLVDKIDFFSSEINKILLKRYSNNKSNTLFQEVIDTILEILLESNNTHLSFDLYNYIKDNYKVQRNINVINETRLAGIKTMKHLKLVNELIDSIEYFNFMNDNKHNTLLKLRIFPKSMNKSFSEYKFILYNYMQELIKDNKDLISIYNKLKIKNNKISNKLLYQKLLKIKEEFRQTLYSIHYGTSTSNKDTNDPNNLTEVLKSSIMPFMESGALDMSDRQFNLLNINTLFCNKSNKKFIKNLKNGHFNNHKIDGQVKVISEGENTYNKKKFNKSYYIHYQYIPSINQRLSFQRILKKLKKSCINASKLNRFDNFKDYIRCTYEYPYFNQKTNFNAFKQYFKENIQSSLNIKFNHIYPYANIINAKKNKYLSFTSWNNNVYKDYSLRKRINRNLSNIIYNIDLMRKITKFYSSTTQILYTKRKHRLFLKNLLVEIKANYMDKFNSFLANLIKETNNRIYLFKTYGIDALLNQIKTLKQFYNIKFIHKNMTQAKYTKDAINTLELLIPLRKQYLEFLKLQRSTIEKNLKSLNPHNVLIQSILHENIENYIMKTIIRKIDQPRSPKELILMACNNVKPLYIQYMKSMPIYTKEINTELSKFDEILNLNENVKIEYIDKESKINVIALFKAIIKFDKYLKLNDLYKDILEMGINKDNKVKDYIYKEKLILNQ